MAFNFPQSINCVRCLCRCEIERGSGVGYCPDCVNYFAERQKTAAQAARSRSKGKAKWFAEPSQSIRPSDCPVTITSGGYYHCGCCGSMKLDDEYGLCLFGIGTFKRCEQCGLILDFVKDKGD